MALAISEQGKQKILAGLLAMENTPFYEDNADVRARYDTLRIGVSPEGQLTVELVYRGKSVLTMPFPMPSGNKVIALESLGSMAVNIDV